MGDKHLAALATALALACTVAPAHAGDAPNDNAVLECSITIATETTGKPDEHRYRSVIEFLPGNEAIEQQTADGAAANPPRIMNVTTTRTFYILRPQRLSETTDFDYTINRQTGDVHGHNVIQVWYGACHSAALTPKL